MITEKTVKLLHSAYRVEFKIFFLTDSLLITFYSHILFLLEFVRVRKNDPRKTDYYIRYVYSSKVHFG